MALTVFAENMGFFHKGSNGKGIAPLDFCLSPPPPPAGPIPIPYVNMLQASDLAKGSKTVKIDGQPTALEDASYVSTSMGDEMGTQGGSVITHKTKGKGYFALWSSTVLVEGKGVCRHGDPMGQNCASNPFGCFDFAAIAKFSTGTHDNTKPCGPYKGNRVETTPAQRKAVQDSNCWQCGLTPDEVREKARNPPKGIKKTKAMRKIAKGERNPMEADHQPPLKAAWYMGGCNMGDDFKKWAEDLATVRPHCYFCSRSQGGAVGKMKDSEVKKLADLAKSDKAKRLREIDAMPLNSPDRPALITERNNILATFK